MRRSRAASGPAVIAVMAGVAATIAGSGVAAHRLDEYLQAAKIEIDAGRVGVELTLTPGIAVAEAIIADIDRDGDGSLSPSDQQAYAARVLGAIELRADHQPLEMHQTASSFPDVDAVRRGEGTIRLRADAALPSQSSGAHQLLFRNTHRRDFSVYLANAVIPATTRIDITAQRRDADQRELTIDYVLDAGAARIGFALALIGIAAAIWSARLLVTGRGSK